MTDMFMLVMFGKPDFLCSRKESLCKTFCSEKQKLKHDTILSANVVLSHPGFNQNMAKDGQKSLMFIFMQTIIEEPRETREKSE